MNNTWNTALTKFTHYLEAGNRRPATIDKRLYHLEVFARDNPDPWAVTLDDLTAHLSNPRWGPAMRKSNRSTLRVFYAWAVASGKIPTSPAQLLPSVLIPRQAVVPAPEARIDDALASASDRDRLMLLLGSRAGLRRGEIARLAWVDITDTAIRVRDGKGGHGRTVPIGSALRSELQAELRRRKRGELGSGWRYKVDPNSPWVFPAQAGGHMSPDTVGPILKRALGDKATGHALRRRFGTRAYAGTRDLRAVQQLLGHASITTTQLYVAVDEVALRAAVDAAA